MILSLWNLLTLISGVMPLPGAVVAAKIGRYGGGASVGAVLVGLLLGTFNILIMRMVHGAMRMRLRSWESYLPGIYAGALLWALFSEFLAYRLTRLLFSAI